MDIASVSDEFRLPDELWERMEGILPRRRKHKSGGRPPLPWRQVLDGIFYVLRTGYRPLRVRIDNLTGTGSGERSNDNTFLTPNNAHLRDQAIDTVLGGEDEDWLLASIEEDSLLDVDPIDDILSF